MKQFNTEDFNKETKTTQQNVVEQKTEKYQTNKVAVKQNRTQRLVDDIQRELKK